MGIEPTATDPKPPAYGFEVRAGHQTESASGGNISSDIAGKADFQPYKNANQEIGDPRPVPGPSQVGLNSPWRRPDQIDATDMVIGSSISMASRMT